MFRVPTNAEESRESVGFHCTVGHFSQNPNQLFHVALRKAGNGRRREHHCRRCRCSKQGDDRSCLQCRTWLLDSVLDGQFHETPFYREVMQPAGIEHLAGLVSVGATAGRRIAVAWHVNRQINVGSSTIETLRLVHSVSDAACRLLHQAELARRALLTVIDEPCNGITLVTADGVVLHRNSVLRRRLTVNAATPCPAASTLASPAPPPRRRSRAPVQCLRRIDAARRTSPCL